MTPLLTAPGARLSNTNGGGGGYTAGFNRAIAKRLLMDARATAPSLIRGGGADLKGKDPRITERALKLPVGFLNRVIEVGFGDKEMQFLGTL